MIISMIAGFSLPLYQSFQARNDLDTSAQSIAETIRRAQVYARGSYGDGQWGVRVATGTVILFKGTSYAARDPNYDETATIPSSFSVTSPSDVLFTKLLAVPSLTGTFATLSATNNNETRTIAINAEGMVSY